MTEKKLIGKITHYFSKIGVAVIELNDTLKVGEKISIEGASTNFEQTVDSMQIEHQNIEEAKAGQAIGMKVADKVSEHDSVFRLVE